MIKRIPAKCLFCDFEIYIIGEFTEMAFECEQCGGKTIFMLTEDE
jgi:predicted RNA-binding Zn-ribbon protein involved in translation (DUF1610 family)